MFGLQKGSAYSDKGIRTVHTQELIRIMRNNHKDLDQSTKIEGINKYMKNLKNSGFDEKFRREVYNSVVKGYKK